MLTAAKKALVNTLAPVNSLSLRLFYLSNILFYCEQGMVGIFVNLD